MKIAVSLYGLLYGQFMRDGQPSVKDFKHCWPNVNKNLIQPLRDMGHEVYVCISSYKIPDEQLEKEFYEMVQPSKVYYSEFEGSNTFTPKIASFQNLLDKKFDFVVFSRLDLHWFKPIENIQFDKFNFLFMEKGVAHLNWTCDNLYMWPGDMTPIVHIAMQETYHAYRNLPDTHGLMNKLAQYITKDKVVVLSDIEQNSHDNLFYSICKADYKSNHFPVHPEVIERFK